MIGRLPASSPRKQLAWAYRRAILGAHAEELTMNPPETRYVHSGDVRDRVDARVTVAAGGGETPIAGTGLQEAVRFCVTLSA